MRAHRLTRGVIMMILGFSAFACSRPTYAAADLPKPETDLPAGKEAEQRTVVLAGGCFWCTEAVFEQLQGVGNVVSGYAGGAREAADYKKVSEGATDHAEVIQITYDPSKISYGELLRVFFTTHDPTTKDRQGPDSGRQYRSAIFYANDDEKRVGEAYIAQLEQAKLFDAPIVTTLEPLDQFYPAEKYHQDFVKNNPNHPYVQQWAVPKVQKVRDTFSEQVKAQK
jgi:peptide-methionine (S)-S-oxide reductase